MQGKTVIITGATSGIGEVTAVRLAQQGARIVFTARDRGRAEATLAKLQKANAAVEHVFHMADLSTLAEMKRIGAILSREPKIDVLVNNAGVLVPGVPLEEVTFEDWSAIVGANLTGAFLCTQQAFRVMKAQSPRGGRIINNGSISATTPRPNSAPYTATKHAIAGLTKSTALDGRNFDIACGQIDIGNAASDMTQKISTGVIQANGTMAAEPTIDPAHVANAVVYMASLPLDANVLTMTVMATKMPFVGRG